MVEDVRVKCVIDMCTEGEVFYGEGTACRPFPIERAECCVEKRRFSILSYCARSFTALHFGGSGNEIIWASL